MLVSSIFFFSHIVFKRLFLQCIKSRQLSCKGLNDNTFLWSFTGEGDGFPLFDDHLFSRITHVSTKFRTGPICLVPLYIYADFCLWHTLTAKTDFWVDLFIYNWTRWFVFIQLQGNEIILYESHITRMLFRNRQTTCQAHIILMLGLPG